MHSKQKICGRTYRARKKKKKQKSNISCDQDSELVNLKKWMRRNWCNHELEGDNFSTNSDSFKTKNLCGSCQTQVGKLAHLQAVSFPTTGRGLMARKQFAAGDVLIEIPRGLMVSSNDVSKDSVLENALENSSLKFTSCELLTAFLLHHKTKKQSDWQPYIESLPKVFHTASLAESQLYPAFIRGHLIKHLTILEAACKNIRCIFNHIKGSCSEITTEEIEWAYMAVNSRTVYLKPKKRSKYLQADDDGCCALAPFLDLLNHSFEANVSVALDERGMYQVVTHVPYDKYDQVFINYGPHDNAKLFVEYGFFIPNNPHDGIPISIDEVWSSINDTDLPKSVTASRDAKKNIVNLLGEAKNMFLARDGPSWSLEVVATIMLLPEEQLRSWQTVYSGCCSDGAVKTVLERVIRSSLRSLQKALDSMRRSQHQGEHFKMGCSLVQEYVNLTEECLHAYLK